MREGRGVIGAERSGLRVDAYHAGGVPRLAPGKGSGERCELPQWGPDDVPALIDFIALRRQFELLVKSELTMGNLISRGCFCFLCTFI
jgi:hypothetical protein